MDDLKAKIEEIVKKIQSDSSIEENFKKNPVKTVENLVGIDLPDDKINAIVDGVKAKLLADNAGGILDKIKGLF